MRDRELKNLEGKSVKDAKIKLAKLGLDDIRVYDRNSIYTADYRPNRVNLEIDRDTVVKATKG